MKLKVKASARNELHDYQHKQALSNEVFTAVKPIYEELSRDELLSRCLGGFTQNSNESFNAVLWVAPKTVHSAKAIVDIAANIAVCNFNDGFHSIMEMMQVLNLTIGNLTIATTSALKATYTGSMQLSYDCGGSRSSKATNIGSENR